MIIDYCRKYFITNKVIGFEKQELLIVAGKFQLESTRLSVCLAIIISKQIFSGNFNYNYKTLFLEVTFVFIHALFQTLIFLQHSLEFFFLYTVLINTQTLNKCFASFLSNHEKLTIF